LPQSIFCDNLFWNIPRVETKRSGSGCCDVINISGLRMDNFYVQGNYYRENRKYNKRAYYKQHNGKYFLFYHNISGWWHVYDKLGKRYGKIFNTNSSRCPPKTDWKENFWTGSLWKNQTLGYSEVTCGRSYPPDHAPPSEHCASSYTSELNIVPLRSDLFWIQYPKSYRNRLLQNCFLTQFLRNNHFALCWSNYIFGQKSKSWSKFKNRNTVVTPGLRVSWVTPQMSQKTCAMY